MYCRKCGAAVSGNYCCVCGYKVRSPWEELRLAKLSERRMFKDRYKGPDHPMHFYRLAELCWDRAAAKYDLTTKEPVSAHFENLPKITEHAQRLFDIVVDF